MEGNLGEAAIEPYLERLRPGVEAYPATMHFMGNQYVRVEGEAGHVETYAVAYHMEADGSPIDDLVMGVRYCDNVTRTADGWRISRRRVAPRPHAPPVLTAGGPDTASGKPARPGPTPDHRRRRSHSRRHSRAIRAARPASRRPKP